MDELLSIKLDDLRFFGFHGHYPEEKLTGHVFGVDLVVSYHPVQEVIRHIAETINYVTLYEHVKAEMGKRRELLETLAMEMIDDLHQRFPLIAKAELTITKLNPPIPGFQGNVSIRYVKEFPKS